VAGLFDKAKEFAKSERGEKLTDSVLDKVADVASKRTGGKHDDQIAKARRAADEHLGRNRGEQ
jgi:hypothetical protein